MSADITDIVITTSAGFEYHLTFPEGAQLKEGQVIAIAMDPERGRPFATRLPGDGLRVVPK